VPLTGPGEAAIDVCKPRDFRVKCLHVDQRQRNHSSRPPAIPYRCRNGKPEFCLITSIRRGNWDFPRGSSTRCETPAEAALKEALEEAGLHGEIEGKPLGHMNTRSGTRPFRTVFLMRVDQADDDWLEAKVRKRRWSRTDEARELIERAELREMLDAALPADCLLSALEVSGSHAASRILGRQSPTVERPRSRSRRNPPRKAHAEADQQRPLAGVSRLSVRRSCIRMGSVEETVLPRSWR